MDFEKNLLLLYLKNIKQGNVKVARLLELIAKKKKVNKKEDKDKQEIEDENEAHQFVYHY